MGDIVARDVYGVASPRIGLLNIGEEDMKGDEIVQEAHALLQRERRLTTWASSRARISSPGRSMWW